MVDSSPIGEVVWRVLPLEPPRLLRHCPRCECRRPFASTDKFRLNAQQRNIDVWLLYRCTHCDSTWKREILARRRPDEIDAGLYERFLRNDIEMAWHYAFATAGLEREESGARVDLECGATLRSEDGQSEPSPASHSGVRIRLELPYPTSVRLDRLLAGELRVTRSELKSWVAGGRLGLEGGERALRRPIRDGQVLLLRPACRNSAGAG